MNEIADIWLPIGIAIVGVGGTIAVTVIQLKARRHELEDEREARREQDAEHRREAIITAVYDAMGPLVAAVVVPRSERNGVPAGVTRATARVERVIRLSGRDDIAAMREWWSARATEFGRINVNSLQATEVAVLSEIDDWFDGRATAAEILERARSAS